ncbi:hypothetical protein EDB85DRAFT_1891177 [Lactarius pseudohatsudake]|nr:hypothetical protein EDB85DRAFT_1891177 [Lactarius pseudohatsudake]
MAVWVQVGVVPGCVRSSLDEVRIETTKREQENRAASSAHPGETWRTGGREGGRRGGSASVHGTSAEVRASSEKTASTTVAAPKKVPGPWSSSSVSSLRRAWYTGKWCSAGWNSLQIITVSRGQTGQQSGTVFGQKLPTFPRPSAIVRLPSDHRLRFLSPPAAQPILTPGRYLSDVRPGMEAQSPLRPLFPLLPLPLRRHQIQLTVRPRKPPAMTGRQRDDDKAIMARRQRRHQGHDARQRQRNTTLAVASARRCSDSGEMVQRQQQRCGAGTASQWRRSDNDHNDIDIGSPSHSMAHTCTTHATSSLASISSLTS